MKLEEVYLIVENYDKVKDQDGMSARINVSLLSYVYPTYILRN